MTDSAGMRGPVVVTGTDTGVGKTIVTAAVAAAAGAAGLRVAVVKPAQTGMPGGTVLGSGHGAGCGSGGSGEAGAGHHAEVGSGAGTGAGRGTGAGEESDMQTVMRLAGPAVAGTLASYPHPLAPLPAARISGLPALPLDVALAEVRRLTGSYDLVLVEGAGGLLVPVGLTGAGAPWTVADLAARLAAVTVVVARAGLGTLNHTALTLEALARREIAAVVVIGAWPAEPGLVHRSNLADLPGQLVGVLPERAGSFPPAIFRASAPTWLGPTLHGVLDVGRFRRRAQPG